MRNAIGVAALVGAVCPSGLVGQAPGVVSFRPGSAFRAQTTYEITGTQRFIGFPNLPDTSLGRYSAMVSRSRRIIEPLDGAWLVQIAYDSSRMHYQPTDDQPWLALPLPRRAVGPYRFLIDERLNVSPMDASDEWEARVIRGLMGQPEFTLPEAAMSAGSRWTGSVSLPYTVELPGDQPTTLAVELKGRATTSLDSVVARSADTLAYLSINAGLQLVHVDTALVYNGESYPVTISGSLGSSLVWSTGWDDWVTGVTRLRIHHRVDLGPASLEEITMFADLVSRFVVRP